MANVIPLEVSKWWIYSLKRIISNSNCFNGIYARTLPIDAKSRIPLPHMPHHVQFWKKIRGYCTLVQYLWRIASRKETASPSSEKSPEAKLGHWRWLTVARAKGALKTDLWEKRSHVLGLKICPTIPQKCQFSRYGYLATVFFLGWHLGWPHR